MKLNPRKTILLSLSFALSFAAMNSVHAASDGSLDSMWMDQEAPPQSSEPGPGTTSKPYVPSSTEVPATSTKTGASTVPPAATSTLPTTEVPAATDSDESTLAPMCKLDSFRSSAIVSKGGWPGVGPFKAENNNDYSDDHNNRIHLDLTGEQITRAELSLANRLPSSNSEKELLDMQMHIDFLLEAVGIRPSRIQDLNNDLAKNKESILTASATPLNLKVGRCSVTIEKRAAEGQKFDYLIAVNSLDASQQVLKQHSVAETPVRTPPPVAKPIEIAQPATPVVKTPVKPTPAISTASDTTLKDQFANVIADWQRVKKGAVRNRATEDLATVLAGKALVRQTDAVKWLVTNHKYYEMSPKGVVVDQFTELAPARKYMVAAQVREAYKFIDEPTGKVLKEVDDVNKVNYTIEKVGGKWLITDSALLAAPTKAPKATANKTTR